MKTKHALTLAAALLLAPLTTGLAQTTWETVDELTPWRGRDIVADAAGNFISLAIDNATCTSCPVTTTVSLSSDHGATWQTVGSIAGYALDLAAAPDGALFATGNRSATVSGRAFVWQSLDHGVTWTVSDPSVGLATGLIVADVAAGNTDSIYVGGMSNGRWMLRKGQRTASGITWSTVDSQPLGEIQSVFVRPTAAGQPDEVLVCGGGWTVRRSLDGGATWTTLANPVSTYSSQQAGSLTVSPNGSIFVVGRVSKTTTTQTKVGKKIVTTTTTESGLLTRRSTNGGASWTDVDYVVNGSPAYSCGLNADAFGRVFAVGWITPETWLVRGSADGGTTWVTTDSFLPAETTRAHALGVASDALGNVCVIGETGTNSVTYTAPIRRLAAP